MNMLAFDTCFGACSVAATRSVPQSGAGSSRRCSFRFERLERGHAERLMPMISEVMAEAPFGFDALDRIVVTVGPGTFTGQRVGIGTARALALASGAQVVSLSSLAVLAYTAAAKLGAMEASGKVLAAAVDARRGEIYFQAFAAGTLAPIGEPSLVTPEIAVSLLGTMDTIAAGSGAGAVAAAARACEGARVAAYPGALEPDVQFIPEAAVLGAPTGLPRPLYLRPPDAKPQDGFSLKRVS